MAAALAAGLVGMVAELSAGRDAPSDLEQRFARARERAAVIRAELLSLADDDARAFAAVLAARRLPKASDEERAARASAVASATLTACRVPLRIAELATETLDLAGGLAAEANPNAASDVGVAALLAAAATRGALVNVRINLPGLPSRDPFGAEAALIAGSADALTRRAAEVETATLPIVSGRIGPS